MTDPQMKKNFTNDLYENLLKAHIVLQYLSPVAIIVILSYFIGTMYLNPARHIILTLKLIITLYFGLEFLIEFILYEDKIQFIKNYWWRVALIAPLIGVLRIIGKIAHLSRLLHIVKITEKMIASLDHYGYIREKN